MLYINICISPKYRDDVFADFSLEKVGAIE